MQYIQSRNVLFSVLVLILSISSAQERTNATHQDIELGKVSWYRDYDQAIALSAKEGKPVLILFQEIPGCATCRNYGHDVLSSPLMAEAIEDLFIPLAIYNNKKGKDAVVLKQFREPSWNNPVVRIVNKHGQDLTKRVAGNYSAAGLYKAMENVLLLENKTIPPYMQLLGEELAATSKNTISEKYFKMYCFWTGEKHLGSAKGVLNTEAGFMKGHEVVKVTYDKSVLGESILEDFAKDQNMLPLSKDNSYRTATKDEDYFLQHTIYKYLPLSKLQRTKINSAIGQREAAEKYLSPRQLAWLKQLKNSETSKEVRYNQPFIKSWEALSSR